MPEYFTPGVYVEELPTARPMVAVGTTTAGFVGVAPDSNAHLGEASAVYDWPQFLREFASQGSSTDLSNAVYGFFQNGGSLCYVANLGSKGRSLTGSGRGEEGLDLLARIDEIAIVAGPGCTDQQHHHQLIEHAEALKDRVAILDPPGDVTEVRQLTEVATTDGGSSGSDASGGGASSPASAGLRPRVVPGGDAAMYWPWLRVLDPLGSDIVTVPPSGHVAGIWARNDGTRGVHKAPANEPVRGALGLPTQVTDPENGALNNAGINVIRYFPAKGILVWGARTLAENNSPNRYLNVVRFLRMLRESIIEGTSWVVFESNGPALWPQVARDISAFLTRVWRDGGLFGRTPEEAFYVRCDATTNPPEERDAGRLICEIGVAVLRPAEFVILRLTQAADLSQIVTVGGTRV